MEFKDILPLAITVFVAVAGWLAAHWLTSRRAIEQKKRELRVRHLRRAYLKLANVADRGSLQGNIFDIQDSFNDIQLFGQETQIALIGRFVEEAGRGESPRLDELLKELRNELRGHIGLAPIEGYRWFLRLRKTNEP